MKTKFLFFMAALFAAVSGARAGIVITESVIDLEHGNIQFVGENADNNFRFTLNTYEWADRGPQFQIIIEPIDDTKSAQFKGSDLTDVNYWEPMFRRVTKEYVGQEMTAQDNVKKLYVHNVATLDNQFSNYGDIKYIELVSAGDYTVHDGLFSGCTSLKNFVCNVSGTLTLGANVVNTQPGFTVKVFTAQSANLWKAYRENTGANFTVDDSEVVSDQKVLGVTLKVKFNSDALTVPLPDQGGNAGGNTEPVTAFFLNSFTATTTTDVTEFFMDYCIYPAKQAGSEHKWTHVYATDKGNGEWEFAGPAIDVLSGLESYIPYRLEFSFSTNSFGDEEGRAHYPTDGQTMYVDFMTSDLTSVGSVKAVPSGVSGARYDLNGRRLFKAPVKGYYIQNGKIYYAK